MMSQRKPVSCVLSFFHIERGRERECVCVCVCVCVLQCKTKMYNKCRCLQNKTGALAEAYSSETFQPVQNLLSDG